MKAFDIHPFERAGLGAAPFRFVRMIEKVYQAHPSCPPQPAGLCDFCGACIRYCYIIRSADGQEFMVGCECVRKTDREALINATEFEKAIREQKQEANRQRRNEKNKLAWERIQTALAKIEDPRVLAQLAARPHPTESMAAKGFTFVDYIEWMKRYAGQSGMLTIAKMIENL